MMSISELLVQYVNNMDEMEEHTNKMTSSSNKDEWVNALHNRKERLKYIIPSSCQILDEIKEILLYATDDIFEEFYKEIQILFEEEKDDLAIYELICPYLEDFFKSKSRYDELIQVLYIHAFEVNEYFSRMDNKDDSSKKLFLEIIKYKSLYPEVSKSTKDRILGAYEALTSSIGCVKCDETLEYIKEFREFVKSDYFTDKDNPDVMESCEILLDKWCVSFLDLDAKEYNKESLDAYYEYCKEKVSLENYTGSTFEIFFCYLRCLYEKKLLSKKEILDYAMKYYLERVESMPSTDLSFEQFHALFYTPTFIAHFMSYEGEADCYSILQKLKSILESKTPKRIAGFTSDYIPILQSNFITAIIPYEIDKGILEKSIFNHLVKTQLPTYIHSVMVSEISLLIYEYMDKNLLPKMDDVKEFIRKSALLHDVGKTMISEVINLQSRKLLDQEFKLIRLHPNDSKEVLEKNPLLSDYLDIAMGHHKWYNGMGGYPMEFDNTKSPYKMIIDLITIADCIDAATDAYGRNYKKAKTISEVLSEFVKDKGVKYSPYYVELLENTPALLEELRVLTEEKRVDLMYKAYIEV